MLCYVIMLLFLKIKDAESVAFVKKNEKEKKSFSLFSKYFLLSFHIHPTILEFTFFVFIFSHRNCAQEIGRI